MSDAYDLLALVYDHWQKDRDEAAWAAYLQKLDQTFSRRDRGDGLDGRRLYLDLGCGTGAVLMQMLGRGYDAIGIDASPAMLQQAQERWHQAKALDPSLALRDAPLFSLQDIRDFELYGTVDLMACLLDTVNHLLSPQDLRRFFKCCAHYLNPGGLLIFDALTAHHWQSSLADQVFFEDQEDHTLFWQSEFCQNDGTAVADILLFQRQFDGRYQRREACVEERFHDLAALRAGWASLPLEPLACYNPLEAEPAAADAPRQVHVLRKLS